MRPTQMWKTTWIAVTAAPDVKPRPFSDAAPGILSGVAIEGFFYAYNLDNPDGIKLLNPKTYERLRSLRGDTAVASVPELNDPRDDALFDHGLIKLAGAYKVHHYKRTMNSLSVWLNVIDACNLGCFYCYIPELRKSIDPEKIGLSRSGLSVETADLIAARLEDYCLHEIEHVHIKFAGGEPTLVIHEIDKFCASIKQAISKTFVTFGILSNGVFDADTVLPVLRRHNIAVSFSIDGMQDNHDKIRYQGHRKQRMGTWNRILDNIDQLRVAKIHPYLLYTITAKNLCDVEPFANLATSRGCGFRLSLERGRTTIGFDRQRETATYLAGFYGRFARSAPAALRLDRDAKFAEWTLDRRKTLACGSCRGYFAIDSVGRVSSCQMRLDEPIADLRETELSSAIDRFGQDIRTRKLRNPAERTGACTDCEFRFVCAGGCPQHTREVWGDGDRPSPWCFVYGSLLPRYIEANATHLARRFASVTPRN